MGMAKYRRCAVEKESRRRPRYLAEALADALADSFGQDSNDDFIGFPTRFGVKPHLFFKVIDHQNVVFSFHYVHGCALVAAYSFNRLATSAPNLSRLTAIRIFRRELHFSFFSS